MSLPPNPPSTPYFDPNAPTQPVRTVDPLAHYQPIQITEPPPIIEAPALEQIKPKETKRRPPAHQRPPRQRRSFGCCGGLLAIPLLIMALVLVYLFFPFKTRVLLLGVDRAEDGSYTGRTDTIILVQVNPLQPDVRMLSIPRDLWVPIPGVGENRINTAHFFAEANQPGSGPQAVMEVVEANFSVRVGYYARVRFDGFANLIDTLGGVTITLDEPMGNLDAGRHHLDGAQALAFARDRSGTDDFFRMQQGQYILLATARQMINPLTWPRLPAAASAFFSLVDTNLPAWEWPRLGLALLRGGMDGVDHRTITREMVTPFLTDGGAQVLLPNWEFIRPMISEMFGN